MVGMQERYRNIIVLNTEDKIKDEDKDEDKYVDGYKIGDVGEQGEEEDHKYEEGGKEQRGS